MIFALLKQLPIALARYLSYRVRHFLGLGAKGASPDLEPATADRDVPFDIGLANRLGAEVAWPAENAPEQVPSLQQNALFKLWQGIPGGSKWSQYFAAYEAVFSGVRHDRLKVLEIGVFRGSSLRLWRKYFDHPETLIVGIDIDPACAQYADPEHGVQVMIGSQVDSAFLDRVIQRFGLFDIIIDDGSHLSGHVIATFNKLFLDGLAQSGIYLAEDLHTQYWSNYRNSELSFIDIAKQMVELMHSHYRRQTDINTFWKGYEPRPSTIKVPLVTKLVQEVRFFDSIVAIQKRPMPHFPQIMLTDGPAVAALDHPEAEVQAL
jgi:hypothetical protein